MRENKQPLAALGKRYNADFFLDLATSGRTVMSFESCFSYDYARPDSVLNSCLQGYQHKNKLLASIFILLKEQKFTSAQTW